MLRHRINPPRDLFPANPWAMESLTFSGEYQHEAETFYALANGYLGQRGSPEEDYPVGEPGTYLNGFHEIRTIVYGEEAYGFPKTGQTMLNCPDGKIIKLYVDGEPFDVASAEMPHYHRKLDMQRATLDRDLVWATPGGKHIRLKTTRLVSLTHRHLAAMLYEVTAEDADADIVISSEMVNRNPMPEVSEDPRLGHDFATRVLHPTGHLAEGLRAVFSFITERSRLTLGCGVDQSIETDCLYTVETRTTEDFAAMVFKIRLRAGETVRISKYLAYHYSAVRGSEELRSQTIWTLDNAITAGFAEILQRQEAAAADFWASSDVVIEEDPEKQQVIRWNLFQLLQASACVDGTGIGARGLTGRTYEGHYFWDTEIYVLPFLIYTSPRIARNILKFRYDKLDHARHRARQLGHKGALFPWRTINGEEASAYFAASTAQYHINADIMYAMRKYVELTGDEAFLHDYGAEMLVETARLWVTLGFYNQRQDGKFCITGVTGPDEYNAIVNNNYFTNLMAREHLRYAVRVVRSIQQDHPRVSTMLVRKTGLEEHEIAEWEKAADLMYLPYDEKLGIHPQDDSFLEKAVWDFAHTPEDRYPLLLFYHPLNLYRHQVIKQADTILVMFLLGQEFSQEQKKRNFDYYDPLTTHDSSLSVCIQSILANQIGYFDKALDYFYFAVAMDLSDVGGNVRNGAHIASIGGSWLALVYGFGGLSDHGGRIVFQPRLPAQWTMLAFTLTVRGSRLHVEINRESTTYSLGEGAALDFAHHDEQVSLTAQSPTATFGNRHN